MLVLSRKTNQRVVITCGGERIVVSVCDVRGATVQLGFEADAKITIDREEIHERKRLAP